MHSQRCPQTGRPLDCEDGGSKRHDLSGLRVLVADDFVYWGGSGPTLPPDLLGELTVGRGHRRIDSPDVTRRWARFMSKHPRGIQGAPRHLPKAGCHEGGAKRCRPLHPGFWRILDEMVAASEVVIDRPRRSRHPRYPGLVYPLDYGYLRGTSAMDGGGIDVWRGTAGRKGVVGIVCTADRVKRDSEIKILLDCTPEEMSRVATFHNNSRYMGEILIPRET